jgi:peptide/nickel transport system substrate-binding protein
MKKAAVASVILIALLVSSAVPFVLAAQPPIDPTTLYIGTISLGRLRSDPKRAYDTASGGAQMNTFDFLIQTTKEDGTAFVPNLATEWGKDTSTPGQPIYWFKLRFTNDTGDPILFHPWEDRNGIMHTTDVLTMDDVIYSFYYGLVQDLSGSPMWMYWLPIFDTFGMPYITNNLDPAEAHGFVTELMTNRIWQNGTHIFFKHSFEFPENAWYQVLAQTWAGIVNKAWAIDRGCWDGTWFKNEVAEAVGTGDGTTTRFTLPQQDMPLGGADAYKKVVPGSETIYLGGAPTTAYTMIYNNGTIDFDTAPGAGVAITASYEHAYFYYFRRFPEASYGPQDSKLPDYDQTRWASYRMCGTGPYIFTGIDSALEYFRHDRFDNYWGGWALSAAQPAHVDTVITSWIDGDTDQWPTRVSKFLAGDYDIIAVPRDSMFDLFKPYDINNPNTWLPVDGVYGIKNIAPVVALDAIHFTFDINSATAYAGSQEFPDGIPLDFFSNIHVRKAFAQLFNFTQFLQDAYYGEAEQPTTWSIRGLNPDYTDLTLTKWTKSLEAAKTELQQAMFTQGATTQSAWDWGFYMTITYNGGNKPRETMCFIIRDALAELTSYGGFPAGHFSADLAEIDWGTYLDYFIEGLMPFWTIGWLQDFSDPDNFVRPYMHSEGDFAYFQGYSNPTVDELVDWGVKNATYISPGVPNPDREYCYKELQRLYLEDCPGFAIDQALGRNFRRTWVKGWYYNSLRPGFWFYHYYKASAAVDTLTDQINTVTDLNDDNLVDMKDIGISVKAFGSTPGTPKWNFKCDVAQSLGDRKVDMKDIGYVVSKFGWAA